MSADNLEPVGDIIVWVDTTLRARDTAGPQPVSSRLAVRPFTKMGSFVEGSVGGLSAGAVDIPEVERRNMSLAECEQCALDDFWGLVANQAEQAEATAAMEMEDRRSEAVRARMKKEEKCALWEQEDLRTRETRSVVMEQLEDAARREYLEVMALFVLLGCLSPWTIHSVHHIYCVHSLPHNASSTVVVATLYKCCFQKDTGWF